MCTEEGTFECSIRDFRYLQKNIGKNPGKIVFDPLIEHDDEKIFNGPLDNKSGKNFTQIHLKQCLGIYWSHWVIMY